MQRGEPHARIYRSIFNGTCDASRSFKFKIETSAIVFGSGGFLNKVTLPTKHFNKKILMANENNESFAIDARNEIIRFPTHKIHVHTVA